MSKSLRQKLLKKLKILPLGSWEELPEEGAFSTKVDRFKVILNTNHHEAVGYMDFPNVCGKLEVYDGEEIIATYTGEEIIRFYDSLRESFEKREIEEESRYEKKREQKRERSLRDLNRGL
jgi:hypothetical protein